MQDWEFKRKKDGGSLLPEIKGWLEIDDRASVQNSLNV